MIQWLSKFLDHSSEFLARRKGLLPLIRHSVDAG
jgi:hypothetical protein